MKLKRLVEAVVDVESIGPYEIIDDGYGNWYVTMIEDNSIVFSGTKAEAKTYALGHSDQGKMVTDKLSTFDENKMIRQFDKYLRGCARNGKCSIIPLADGRIGVDNYIIFQAAVIGFSNSHNVELTTDTESHYEYTTYYVTSVRKVVDGANK